MQVRRWKRLSALIACVALLLSACGGGGGGGGAQQPATQEPSSEPAPQTGSGPEAPQEIRIAIASEGDTLDPAHFSLVTSYAIATNIFSALVRYTPGTIDLEPDLAERWETSEDGMTWTFHLRRGVKWHKGYGELTAQDVVASYERVMDPDTGSRWLAQLENIDRIEAPDDYTVVFHLKQPDAAFLHTVAAFRQGFIVNVRAAEELGDGFGRNPVGTGPFQLESWVPGSEVVLVANDDYFLGAPRLRKVTFVVIPDENVRMMALERGEVDIAMALTNPEIRDRLAANPDIELGEIATSALHGLVMNTRVKPLDDVRVRRALYMAIDRDAIADVVLGGLAQAAYSELAPPYLGHTTNVPRYEYDPEGARALLAEAGYPDGFKISAVFTNTLSNELIATIVAFWQAIGVQTDVQTVDGGTWVQMIGRGEAPVIWFAATRSDPDVFYKSFLHSNAFPPGLNGSYYDQVDDLIDAGGQEMDPEKRKGYYEQIQQKVMSDLPILPLYWPKHAHPYWSYVKGWGGRQQYDAWMYPVYIEK